MNNIERVKDGFKVKVYDPKAEDVLIHDKWLDKIIDFTKPKGSGISPEVLSATLIYNLAKDRYKSHIDRGFAAIIDQVAGMPPMK